jgi:DNA polymerase I-like protein with 3'-5' exonuclease and polymerase domains
MLRADFGFVPEGSVVCTQVLGKVVHFEWHKHDLGTTALRLGLGKMDKSNQKADWSGHITQEMYEYAAKDAQILLPIYERLMRHAKGLGGLDWTLQTEERFTKVIGEMSYHGVPVNEEEWGSTIESIRDRILELLENLDSHLPETLRDDLEAKAKDTDFLKDGKTPSSTVKKGGRVKLQRAGRVKWSNSETVARVIAQLFPEVKLPDGETTKEGKTNKQTGKDVLAEKLGGYDSAFVTELLEYRQLQNVPTAFSKATVENGSSTPRGSRYRLLRAV